ncbi:MAG: TIGR03790 family protein, partial [Verrucomicrobia bacterium]|nr:TIGR03790 family protein [Verrucomicrobiota bacterium]
MAPLPMRWLLLSALLGSLAIGSANAAEEPDADSLAATDVGVTPPTMAAGDQVVDTLAIAEGGATPLAAASTSLASRVLVVYNANVPASLNVANYYAAQRGIPASNLLGIRPSSTMGFLDNYHYSKALTEVIAPITNALTQLGQQQILYIVFTYGTPYGVWNDVWTYPSGASLRGASLDAYVCDPFGDAAKGPNVGTSQSTTFFANPYSPGQAGTPLAVAGGINGPVNAVDVNGNPVVVNTVVTYTPFESLAAFRARTGKRIYSVFRLDAANSTIAKAQVDKALQAEQAGGLDFMGGKFYFDRRNPDSLLQTPPPTGAWIYDRWVEWTLFRTKQMAMNVTLPWLQESTFWRIGEPGSNIPTAPNAAYYAGTYGWYNTIGVNGNARPDPWTWLPGAIGMEWKSEGLYGGPRGDNNPPSGTDPNIGWGVGAIAAGITAVTGCITEPYDGGVPRPDAILRNLFEGASIGDAFFRDNWWVGWQQINVGDPLYTPFPGGRPPFKPATGTQLLTIASVNPASGVSVTASPNDNNGQGTGTTQFTRTYNNNQVVNLVAPSTAGGNIFSK